MLRLKNNNSWMIRIGIDCLLLISAFFFPWWVTMLGAVVATFYFRSYYEIVVLGLIIDSLYNASVPRFYGIQYVLTFAAIFFVFISHIIKERLRFYR